MFGRQLTFILFLSILVRLGSGSPYTWFKSENDLNQTKSTQSNRIVGGLPAPDAFAPHMVALLIGSEPWTIMMCGGSIISTKHVLTAAHCIDSMIVWYDPSVLTDTLRGIVGSNKHTSTENVITFMSYIKHPRWNSLTIKNDIGVLFTTKDIMFNDRVTAISLKQDWVNGGESCYATGWGNNGNWVVPEKLQLLYVSTISGQKCIDGMPTDGPRPPPVDPELEICAFHSVGHGMCHGDSGSALVSARTGEQVGIVSWGFPCATGAPDVFVRISAFADFLKPILEHS